MLGAKILRRCLRNRRGVASPAMVSPHCAAAATPVPNKRHHALQERPMAGFDAASWSVRQGVASKGIMLPTQTRIVAAISLASLLGPGSCWIRPLQSPLQQAAIARRPLSLRVSQEAADLDAPVLDAPAPVLESAVTPASRPRGFQDAANRAKTGTVNKRLLSAIDAELKEVQQKKGPDPLTAEEPDTDLNGINPIQPFGSSLFAAMVSLLFWRITVGLSVALNKVHLDTDFYPAQRLFSIASTSFVGIMALGAGVIGVTALGLLGLALRVSIGILAGELDPDKKKEAEAPRSPIPLDAKGLPKITGAWYDIKSDNKDLNTRRD